MIPGGVLCKRLVGWQEALIVDHLLKTTNAVTRREMSWSAIEQ
jgi:hypothetical protein